MATHKQTDRQTYTRVLQCSLASVGLAQAHPGNMLLKLTLRTSYNHIEVLPH